MRCEKDQMAIVKKAINPENVSKIVECKNLIGFLQQGEIFVYNNMRCEAIITDHYWWVVTKGQPFVTGMGESSMTFIPDLWLEPIKPDLLDDDEDTVVNNTKHLEKVE